jgi:hypothetical protein
VSGASLIDAKTFVIWREAIIDALRGDRHELVLLLRRPDVMKLMTNNAAEFIAWLLEERQGEAGRKVLPLKFKLYQEMARHPHLFDALDELHQRRVATGGKLKDVEKHYDEVAETFGVDREALEREDKRSRKSGRKIGF